MSVESFKAAIERLARPGDAVLIRQETPDALVLTLTRRGGKFGRETVVSLKTLEESAPVDALARVHFDYLDRIINLSMASPAVALPLADWPGLRDLTDWVLVESVPDTLHASPNGAHWAAMKRLFTWMVARQSAMEEELKALRERVAWTEKMSL